MKIFGKRLRNLRKNKKLTLRELGEKLNTSFSLLAMYERGERDPSVDKLELIADFFNVSTDYLLGRTNIINSQDSNYNHQIPYKINMNKPPVISEKNIINNKELTKREENTDKYFYLEVSGDWMTGSRIHPGDKILVKKQDSIENGNIAVVVINKSLVTIKRIYVISDRIILLPDNPKYRPVIIESNKVKIIGKVVKVEFFL